MKGSSRGSVIAVMLMLSAHARADVTLTEIGTLNGAETPYAEPTDVNHHGQVVGFSTTGGPPHAFSWTAGGGLVDVGASCGGGSEARFVAANGYVFGFNVCAASPVFGRIYVYQAFAWHRTHGMSSLTPAYGEETIVYHVNTTTAQAIGYSCRNASGTDCRAFSWTPTGGMVQMNPDQVCFPYDVNDGGQAVGYCGTKAFIWSEATGMVFIDPLTPGDACYAEAINDLGQVVGNCDDGLERFGFSWTAAGGMRKITLAGSTNTYARAVNNAGQVGGQSAFATLGRAWVWTAQDGAVPIDPGNGVDSSFLGLTEDGHVVGYATELFPSTGVQRAFGWSEQDGLVMLALPNGGNSYPRDWSDNGKIVGYANDANGAMRAFLWSAAGGMIELAPPAGANPNGRVSDAYAVNGQGQVAGFSYFQDPNTLQWRYTATVWNTQPLDDDGDGVPDNEDLDDDNDQLPDSIEVAAGLDPFDPADALMDLDGDGLSNLQEYQLGTAITRRDTDGDGVDDGVEVAMGSDPRANPKAASGAVRLLLLDN